jgi:hypothetical protein
MNLVLGGLETLAQLNVLNAIIYVDQKLYAVPVPVESHQTIISALLIVIVAEIQNLRFEIAEVVLQFGIDLFHKSAGQYRL